MTLAEAISHIDTLKYNTFTRQEKLRWLSDVESRIRREVVDTHEGGPEAPFVPFTPDTPPDTELTAKPPYDQIYLRHLETQMDYHSGEIDKYNNSSALLAAVYGGFCRYYNRTHMPKGQNWKFP